MSEEKEGPVSGTSDTGGLAIYFAMGEARSDPSLREDVAALPSGESTVIFTSLGQDLRNARHCRGLELSHISNRLKISKRYLTAIEESDLNVLPPGNVYLVGYVRSYAAYLGLDSNLSVEKLKIEIAEREAKRQATVSIKQIEEPSLASSVRHIRRFFGLTG